MFETLKETWHKIQQDPPGKRFRRQYRRRQNARDGVIKRLLFLGLGSIFSTLGLIMIFTPGSGILLIFIGLGFIAQESLLLAIMLDKMEVSLREWIDWGHGIWKEFSFLLKFLIVVVALGITVFAVYWGYQLFWL